MVVEFPYCEIAIRPTTVRASTSWWRPLSIKRASVWLLCVTVSGAALRKWRIYPCEIPSDNGGLGVDAIGTARKARLPPVTTVELRWHTATGVDPHGPIGAYPQPRLGRIQWIGVSC